MLSHRAGAIMQMVVFVPIAVGLSSRGRSRKEANHLKQHWGGSPDLYGRESGD
jgi:hypothetical protein